MIVHTYTLWVHEEGVGGLLFCCVLCCAVLQLYQVLCPAVIQGGTVVDRPPSPDRSLARSPAVVRSPAATLVIIITTYRYYYNTRGVYTCILNRSLNRNACTPSSAQAQHCIAALPCGEVLYRAALCFRSNMQQHQV